MDDTEKKMTAELIRRGYGVITPDQYRIDIDQDFLDMWEKVKEFKLSFLTISQV